MSRTGTTIPWQAPKLYQKLTPLCYKRQENAWMTSDALLPSLLQDLGTSEPFSLQLLRASSAGFRPQPLVHTHSPFWGSREQHRHGGLQPVAPRAILAAFPGEKGFSSRTILWPGLIVMAAAQDVSWSTPPRNLHSGNTLASGNNREIYLQIPSNMRHHVRIRLKWLIWGNCRKNSPSLCHFFPILK